MKKDIELHYLSNDFYSTYDAVNYPEIEHKSTRPYAVLLVEVEQNKFAIPFRTNIKHNNCFKFSKTGRQTIYGTGLDFTKAVIVNDGQYIGQKAIIDNKEYVELSKNVHQVVKKFTAYVKRYKKYKQGIATEYYKSDFQYSTLKYFDNELNLKSR